MFTYDHYTESAEYIKSRLNGFVPEFLMILGSGLGSMADEVEDPIVISYKDIPHFKVSTAPGHAGAFVAGKIAGKNVLFMKGRLHVYEGYTAEEAAYPVRVAKLLGVHSMIVTNASGGVNTSYKVGELVIINDFVKLAWANPLFGQNINEFGPRFCDMTYTFDREYIEKAKEAGRKQNLELKEGVYFYMTGPQYETPAEIRAVRVLGGDLVGMSTVHECIVANHAGIRTLGISLVSNMAAGVLDVRLSEQEVLDEGAKARGYFSKLIVDFLSAV